jgi:hypothetical protein
VVLLLFLLTLQVDPAERITPDEALQHPWICQHQSDRAFGNILFAFIIAAIDFFYCMVLHNSVHLPWLGADYNTRLKLMEARSKFRKAVRVIIALNRFQFDDRNFSVADI